MQNQYFTFYYHIYRQHWHIAEPLLRTLSHKQIYRSGVWGLMESISSPSPSAAARTTWVSVWFVLWACVPAPSGDAALSFSFQRDETTTILSIRRLYTHENRFMNMIFHSYTLNLSDKTQEITANEAQYCPNKQNQWPGQRQDVDAAALSGWRARLTKPGWVIKSNVSSNLFTHGDDSSRTSAFQQKLPAPSCVLFGYTTVTVSKPLHVHVGFLVWLYAPHW